MPDKIKLISSFYEKIPADAIENTFTKEFIRKTLKGRFGVYALWNDRELYYIGQGKLYSRIISHYKRDKHVGKWNKFSFAILNHQEYAEEIESLLLSFAMKMPPGNKNMSQKLVRDINTEQTISKILELANGNKGKVKIPSSESAGTTV
ncbi:MAG: hypothetical protein QXN16_03655, partial [Candidatus Micrarchaeaceae archaeon]